MSKSIYLSDLTDGAVLVGVGRSRPSSCSLSVTEELLFGANIPLPRCFTCRNGQVQAWGFLSLTPEHGKANFKWCCCYEEHSWPLLLRLRPISPLMPLFLFCLFPVCGRSREHEFNGLVINTSCKGFWAFVRLQITYIIMENNRSFSTFEKRFQQ